jgi:hypothetical protein
MSLANGELLQVAEIPAFDQAIVTPDLCVLVSARSVFAIDSRTLQHRWTHGNKGERYHRIGRVNGARGDFVYVVTSFNKNDKKQGLVALDAASGKQKELLVQPTQKVIHDLAVDARGVAMLVSDLYSALPRDALLKHMAEHPDDDMQSPPLGILALSPETPPASAHLWHEALEAPNDEELPEVSISTDSGRLYVIRGALLEARDLLTGRKLDQWAVPGLDERVAWRVSQGAGLLAEETRVSIFELPA